MNLLARILSHGFALAVVVLLGIALMYRGDLFQEWKLPEFLVINNESVDSAAPAVDTAEPAAQEATATEDVAVPATTRQTMPPPPAPRLEEVQQEVLAQETSSPEDTTEAPVEVVPQTVSSEDTAETPVDVEPQAVSHDDMSDAAEAVADQGADESAVVDSVTQTDTTAPTAVEAPDEVAAEDVSDKTVTTGTETTGMAASTAAEAAEPSAAEADIPAPAESQTAAPPPAPAADSAYGLLAAAREAYWLRDYAQAEASYLKLIQLEPDNPDGYGELGNMYFAQGQWQQAAAAYYDAGVRLASDGMTVQARQMLEVIRGLNGEQADDLEQLIDQSQPATPAAVQ